MSELKACPYCGSLSVREGCDTPDAKWHYVECDDCHATSKADLGVSGAIENWNTRPLEDALRAQHVAEMAAKVDALEWRDKEICTLRAELEEVKTMMDYTFRQNIEFQLQLDILKQAILDHKDDLIFPKEWCDDALAEIEKEGKGAS